MEIKIVSEITFAELTRQFNMKCPMIVEKNAEGKIHLNRSFVVDVDGVLLSCSQAKKE